MNLDIDKNELSIYQIAFDYNTIMGIADILKNNPIMAAEFIPFLSLFCNEALYYFEGHETEITLPQNKCFSLNDIRLKTKLFEDNYSKAKKMVLNCDYLQDYIFRNRLRFKIMSGWNIHYNLGVFFDCEKNIIGNSQYGYFV